MYVFFDTEFTGLHKDTTLVSIGLVSADGRTFYAECNDFDRSQTDEWFKENVYENLYFKNILDTSFGNQRQTIEHDSIADVAILCSKDQLKKYLSDWFKQFDSVTLVSDVCHYDMVLLVDIFGTAFDLPENVSPCCHDINQDMAAIDHSNEKEVFDWSREAQVVHYLIMMNEMGLDRDLVVKKTEIPDALSTKKHNALYDAYVIRELFEFMQMIKAAKGSWE